MDYCPIMVQITNKHLLNEYGCDYLLQVWNKEGKMVFQKGFQSNIKVWGISNEYLIYKPQGGDEKAEYIHITDLNNGNSTLLVKDPLQDSSFNQMVYEDGLLYIANNSTLYIIEVKVSLNPGEEVTLEIELAHLNKIVPGLPIHALFNYKVNVSKFFSKNLVIIALETEDNQIDFCQVIPQNLGTENFQYILKEQREIVSRPTKMDTIQKFRYMIDDSNVIYSIALRESGHFDIYWNMTLIDSPKDAEAFDIECSFDSLYFRMKKGEIKSIHTSLGSGINFEQSQEEQSEFDFGNIFYQNIKCCVNLYNSFVLIRTTLYITHGQFVSVYNIQDNQWIKHCKFDEGQIVQTIKKRVKKGEKTKFEVAVLLENGAIYNNLKSIIFEKGKEDYTSSNKLMIVDYKHKSFQMPGKVIKTAIDQQKNEWFYLMVKEGEDKIKLFTLHYDSLLEVNDGLVEAIDEQTNFVQMFVPAEQSYLLLQKSSDVYLYQIGLGKPNVTVGDEDNNTLEELVDDIVILDLQFSQNLQCIENSIHSAISLDIKDHIFLVDDRHFYRYSCIKNTTKVYRDQKCVGLYVVDEKFCYTLSHSGPTRSSGLRLYDINNILKKDTDVSYKLQNVQVGYSGFIDWNHEQSRFSILKSLDTLNIIPALHRNTLAFIGMSKRDQYLATKIQNDKFLALDVNNYIFCWSIVTGKLLSLNRLPSTQDYSNYKVFCSQGDSRENCAYYREWYQKVLLVKKEPENDFDETSFYRDEGLVPKAKNLLMFVQIQNKEFREFKLIEIVSENEVREHLVFIHPVYHNEKQRLYFDSKNQYMIEKLNHPRVFLYEKDNSKQQGQSRWKILKRMSKFPADLENDSGFLRVMSPTFQYFIDIDRRENQLIIKDTFSLQEIYRIPLYLMNLKEEPSKDIMNRFKWVDEDIIRIINKEGIEKIIDMKNNFSEIEFNIVQLFDNNEVKESNRSYYSNRKPLSVSQVKDRLIRKYQAYKTAYYLEHKTNPETIYDQIFTVDYQIDESRGMHVADMSFTFLHWKIMEQLESQNLSIDLIDDSQIELLCYNILPGGDTILHKLHSHGDVIKKIFQTAHPNDENISKKMFHIPFLQNLSNKSPMHICQDKQDIRTMDTMLTYLSGYSLDHHSKAIVDVIPFFIEKQLPSLLPYLDSRLLQTDKIKKINKGCMKDNSQNITDISLWFGEQEFEEKLIKQVKEGDDTLIDRPIRVEFVDIPRIYHYHDDLNNEFFAQLASTSQYEIFERKSIQKMIEFNYQLVKDWTIYKLFVPFVCFLSVLVVYLRYIFQQDTWMGQNLDLGTQALLGVFSIYFLQNEFRQMFTGGLEYLTSVWNYIDIMTPTIILCLLSMSILPIEVEEEHQRILQALGVFFMWFKFLYFFRIFKSFGYLTRLIILVIYDMRHFLIVLFFTLVAFGDTFLVISNGNSGEVQDDGTVDTVFVTGFMDSVFYIYCIILGSFDLTDFENSQATLLLKILFIMCTVFNMIVMLNLLIAIISETFSSVKENAANASYQEMASMISENSYLIPDRIKRKYAQQNKYLLVVTDLEQEMEENNDELTKKLNQMRKYVSSKLKGLKKQMKDVNKKQSQHDEMFLLHTHYLEKIMSTVKTIPGVKENEIGSGSLSPNMSSRNGNLKTNGSMSLAQHVIRMSTKRYNQSNH